MRNTVTQRERILSLLQQHRGQWVPLPEILPLAAQYNSRLLELRRSGHKIENKTRLVGGQRHSWFRLVPDEERPRHGRKTDPPIAPAAAGSLFSTDDITPADDIGAVGL